MTKIVAAILLCMSVGAAQSTNVERTPRQLINQLWLVTMIDENGDEIVIAAPTVSGENVPLIAADPDRRDSMMAPAEQIARGKHIKLYLIKLSERTVVEEISP